MLGERTARTSLQRVPGTRWDGRTAPRYLDRIVERLGMTQAERDLLQKNGFVVLGGSFSGYGQAFDFIHRRELPLYVSADALLYALYRSHAEIFKNVETDNAHRLGKILSAMHEELPKARRAYGGVTAADVDLYLAVARSLLEARLPVQGLPPPFTSTIGGGDIARPLLQRMMKDHGRSTVVKLFGRDRVVDWAAFDARGFYRDDLEFYWAAVTWLSRIELNLVSRGSKAASPAKLDATESPREATLALALADLASRSGALSELGAFDGRLRSFAGPREDVTPGDLAELGRGIDLTNATAASEELRRRIGDRYRRTMPTESVEDPTTLPVVATLLGVGITPDGHPLAALANDRELRGADVAYALGHDAARAHVKDADPKMLAEARRRMNEARRGPDAYASWLGVVRSLPEAGADGSDRAHAPSFFASPAYADARMSSALAAFGAIRNVYALVTPVIYRTGSCTIPDAYVEPHAPFFDALTSYAGAMEKIAPALASFVDDEERREREAANAPPPKPKTEKKPKRPAAPAKPLTEEEKKARADDEAKWLLRGKWSEASHAYMKVRARDAMEQPARFARTVAALRAIVEDERAGRPLSTAQLAFLGMVSEYHPYNMYDDERTPPRYNGWYTRLFVGRTHGYDRAVYTGDVFASAKTNTRMQLGALEPRLAVFIVDTQGEPRAVVGPITRAFERVITSSDDGKAAEYVDPKTQAVPWEARYAAPARAGDDGLDPAIAHEENGVLTIEMYSATLPEGAVLERVDAHGATLATGPIVGAKPFEHVPVTMTPRPGATTAPSIRFARLRYSDGSTREIQLWTKEGADIKPSAARR